MAKVSFSRAEYLGGLASVPKRRTGNLWFTDDRVGVGMTGPKGMWVTTDAVESVAVGGGQVAKSKVGAELAFGVFGALGAKGAADRTELHVRLRSGQVAYFTVDKVAPVKVRAQLAAWLQAHGIPFADEVPVAAAAPSTSAADELGKLADLRERGVLSDDEFVAAKAKLLGS